LINLFSLSGNNNNKERNIMETQIVAILIAFRDELKKQSQDILTPAALKLKIAKQEYHDAKIVSNQLIKRANMIQSNISLDDLSTAADQAIADTAYDEKGFTEMRLQYEDQK
jgi:hypothetical protein